MSDKSSQINNTSSIEGFVKRHGIEAFSRFYGAYFGIVISNEDPLNMNRLIVHVPEVFGPVANHRIAIPRGIISGKGFGSFYKPKKGETVIVTFRMGHPGYPMWEPGTWAKEEMPEEFDSEDKIGFKSRNGILILLDDKEDSVTVTNKDGYQVKIEPHKITVGKDSKMEISDDSIKIGKSDMEHATLGDSLKSWLSDFLDLYKVTQVDPGSHILLQSTQPMIEQLKAKLDNILAKF